MLIRTIFLVGLGLILISVAAWDVGNPTLCERADDLVADDRLSEARTEYGRLLQGEPSAGCAKRGLETAVIAQCQAALDLREAGRDEEATKAYLTLATTEPMPPGLLCVRAGLEATCDAADRKARQGLLAAAHDDYVELASHRASQACAAEGLATVRTERCAAARVLAVTDKAAAKKAFEAIAASEPSGSMQECMSG